MRELKIKYLNHIFLTTMKKIVLVIIIIVAFFALPISIFAVNVPVSADAKAKIIAPIQLANSTALDFGTISTSAAVGTVTIPATVTPTATATGGVTILNSPKTASTFTVTGMPNAAYILTLPTSAATLKDNNGTGSNTMTVDTWIESATETISVGGSDIFYVGGTLHIGASQVAGEYKGTFNVTVAYN